MGEARDAMVIESKRVVRKHGPPRRRGEVRVITEMPATTSSDDGSVVDQPDGGDRQAPDGPQEFAPFDTWASVRADRDRGHDDALAQREAFLEAEEGLADSIESVRESGESPVLFDSDQER
jgi:hypothetical protein